MAKEKFEGQLGSTIDKDLNQDGVVDMKEELVAAQAAVASGEVIDPIQGEANIDTLTPVDAVVEQIDTTVIPEGELIESSIIDPATLGDNLTEQNLTEQSETPPPAETKEETKEEIKDAGSEKILDNAGQSVSATFPQVRTVRSTGSFVM